MISLLLFLTLIGCDVEDKEVLDSIPIELEIDYGYDGYVKYGDYMPISATIQNQGGAFTGWFQVIFPNHNNKSTLYQQEIELGEMEVAQLEFSIPVNSSRDQFHYQLVDSSEHIMIEKTVPIKLLDDYAYTLIGIFTNNSTGLEYLEKEGVVTHYLQKDKFINEYSSLNALDILLIDEYELENMNDKNWSVIENWIRQGGNLILGDVPYEEIPFYDKIQEQPDKNNSIFTEYYLDMGRIQIANMSIRSLESSSSSILVQRMLRNLPESKPAKLNMMHSTPYYNYRILDALRISNIEDIPFTLSYVFVIFVYVILVGPVLYLVLKKKRLRILTWFAVPMVAIIFTGIIFYIGKDTRKTQTTGSYMTYQTIGEDGNYIEETYIRLISPENTGYQVPDIEIEPLGVITSQYSYASTGEITEYDYSNHAISITKKDKGSDIHVKEASTFEPTYYTYIRDGKMEGSYNYHIIDEIEKITGEFTNELGYDLEDGIFLCNQVLIPVGDVKDKETISLDKFPQISVSHLEQLYDMKQFSEILFYPSKVFQLEDPEFLRKYYAIQEYLEDAIINYNEKNVLIGFPSETSLNQYSLSFADEIDIEGMTVIVLPIQVGLSTQNGGGVIPSLMPYVEVSGEYDIVGYRYMTNEIVDIRYEFYLEDKIQSIRYSERGNNEFKENPLSEQSVSQNDLTPSPTQQTPSPKGFFGGIYFYNNRTQEYDLIYRSGVEGIQKGLGDYLDERNSILIRYKVDRQVLEKGVAILPNLTAVRGGY